MSVPLELSLISQWQLSRNGTQITVGSRKTRALIAFLALTRGRRHSRETIAQLFWGSVDITKTRASLRQAVAGLNRLLDTQVPDLMWLNAEEIGFFDTAVVTDLDRLRTAIESGNASDDILRAVPELPRMMADLAGVSPGFQSWLREAVAQQTAEIRRCLRAAFEDQTIPLARRQRFAESAYALDDLDEDAVRALMSILAQSGSSVQALRLYGDFYARLEDDLDAEPSTETQDLAVAIKLMRPESQPAPVKPTPARIEPGAGAVVAVLPFGCLSADPLPDFVALGLLDQITCSLAAYRDASVISSNSTRGFAGKPQVDLSSLSQTLNAQYVVTGSILGDADQTAVAVQLVEAESALVLWAGTYRCAIEDLFAIHANVATNIAQAIMPNVEVAELRRAMARPNDELGPYHLVLRAKDLIFRLERDSFDQAGAWLMQAVAANPVFAPAQALLAEWYALRIWQGWTDRAEADRRALEQHIERAISLAPGDGRTLALLGHCRMLFDRRYDEAERLFDRALELLPNDAETLVWTVPTLAYIGKAPRAVDNGRKAIDLSPLDPFRFRSEHFLSIAHFSAAEYDLAADRGLDCYLRAPDFGSNLRMTIASLELCGRHDDARDLVQHHAVLEPDFSVGAFMHRHRLKDQGDRRRFAKALIDAGVAP